MNKKRAILLVDGANFFYTQKNKLNWWVDPTKLYRWIAETKGEIEYAFYYQAVDHFVDNPQQDSYMKALSYSGYTVKTKELEVSSRFDGKGFYKKTSFKTEIATDMFNLIDQYDVAILVSGDSDFEYPLKTLQSRGKKFFVFSTEGVVAREIRAVCGSHFVDFNTLREQLEKNSSEKSSEKFCKV